VQEHTATQAESQAGKVKINLSYRLRGHLAAPTEASKNLFRKGAGDVQASERAMQGKGGGRWNKTSKGRGEWDKLRLRWVTSIDRTRRRRRSFVFSPRTKGAQERGYGADGRYVNVWPAGRKDKKLWSYPPDRVKRIKKRYKGASRRGYRGKARNTNFGKWVLDVVTKRHFQRMNEEIDSVGQKRLLIGRKGGCAVETVGGRVPQNRREPKHVILMTGREVGEQ